MVLDWSKLLWREAERWDIDVSNVTVQQLLHLLDANKRLKAHKQRKKLLIKIAPHQFAKGGKRLVYEVRAKVSRHTHVVKMVAKRFNNGPHDSCLYLRHLELQAVGKILANAFNRAARNQLLASKIVRLEFAKVEMLRVNGHHHHLELYKPGLFVNYKSNVAYGGHNEYFSRILQTFSHWTYQETWGKLMLTDFQGVHLRRDFLLSGLALHYWTNDKRFYNADKGKEGMFSFFRSHRCNSHCTLLGLQPHRLQPS